MNIKLAVFDLDGTLVSSHETIYRAMIHALREVNINTEIPEQKFYDMIGAHFEDIFSECVFSVPNFEYFLSIYKDIYFDYAGLSFIYPGVNEILNSLKERGVKISLLTTKAQDQAELNLSYFKLIDKFDYIMGRRAGIAHKPSPDPLLKICGDLKINVNDTIIIGDSEMDIQCGKSAGAKTCAVSYGYRTKELLKNEEPDFLIDNILELNQIINIHNCE